SPGTALAVMDRGRDAAGFMEPYLALGLDGVCPGTRHGIADHERRKRTDGGDANAHDLYRLAAIVVAIGTQVTVVEGGCDLRQRGCVNRARWNRYHEFMGLTRIARIDGALEPPPGGRNAGPIEHGRTPALEGDE